MRWSAARWPLRVRVALAFLGTTLVALAGLGVFVHVRMSDALEERLRDTLALEADRLTALPPQERRDAVQALGGEVHAQVVAPGGEVLASSPLVAAPLLGSGSTDEALGGAGTGYGRSTVLILDDDASAEGERDAERETSLLLVRPTDDGRLVVAVSREDADEAMADLRAQLLVGIPLALLVAGVLGYLVAGAGLRPIERMRTHAATISHRNAGERLPLPDADDELRRLALTLNAMLDRLDDGLQRERGFVAEASHELRTPLTLMRTEIDLALARPREPEELTAALRSVHDEVRRLMALVEDLLGRAAGDGGSLSIRSDAVDLVATARTVADRFRPAAGPREITVVAPGPVEVEGDGPRLDRALSNLVDNALRHGAGAIEVEIRATGHGAVVTVTDEGDGFPPGDGSPAGTSGLGLSIVREIARAHGGSVEVLRRDDRTCVRMELASPTA